MDENNSFLNTYKKKASSQKDEQTQEAAVSQETQPSMRYEEKSGFKPVQRGRQQGPPSRNKPGKIAPVIIIAAIVLALAGGLIWYLNRGTAVIDMTGWAVNDAQLWASDKKVTLQVDQKYDDKTDAGKVISQNPTKGATVKKGDFIKVTVSLGHDLSVALPLPDLMSMTMDEINAWSAANFMTKVRITTEYSTEVAAGKVISYEVNDNTVVDEVKRDTPVYIVISKGSEDLAAVLITIPDFRQKTVSESYVFADENGITLKINEQNDDYAPKGEIIAQSANVDEKVKKGDEITLTVSKGKKIMVPDFSGYSKAKATALATTLGIPITSLDRYSSLTVGSFISQSIAANTEYADGDILELSYSLGNKIIVASFVGQMRDIMESWAKELNDQGAGIAISATYTQSDSPKGTVLYQSLANTSIAVKTTIKITVSLGKAVFVPDFIAPAGSGYDVAITREKALALCKDLNIVPVFVASSAAGRLPGEIWYQSVAAGKEVAEGATITLKYNPDNVQVTVPDFTHMTQAEILAGDYFSKLDITFVTADATVSGYSGEIFKQSLRAGSKAASGSAITLTISP